MIPPSNSRPFGRVLTPLSEIDLARLIVRTGQLAAKDHHEQGWAAFAVGCDGRKLTTFLDGSACQIEGEICLAQRQDGISSCIDAPARGSGLTSQSIVFRPAACEPVTGWWILDDEGYLYKIPADLLEAVAYYPEDPDTSGARYDLVRSGTWAALMCAAPLTPPTDNGEGGCRWATFAQNGETITSTIQYFRARLGGLLTHLIGVPSISAATNVVTVGAFSGRWGGVFYSKATDSLETLSSADAGGSTLTAGQEYRAIVYGTRSTGATATTGVVKGYRAAAGAAVLPPLPNSQHLPLATVTVPYSAVIDATAAGTTTPKNWDDVRELTADAGSARGAFCGILLRDVDEPNPGARFLEITLPAADSGVVSGPVRVGFGYPFAFEHLDELLDSGAPYGMDGTTPPTGDRLDYDMALVYGPPRIAIEYAPYHLNLSGADIDAPDDWVQLSDEEEPADMTANLLQLPNSEVCLSRKFTDSGTLITPQTLDRFRVRPAPDTAPTVTVAQTSIPSYGTDPNVWVTYSLWVLSNWTPGGTTLTYPYGPWTHGRDLPVVCWQSKTGQQHWSLDPAAVYGTIGAPSGSTAPVTLLLGGGLPALQPGAGCRVSFLGPRLEAWYGWTWTRDGMESALSPLTEVVVASIATATYDITVGVPLGPSGTDERSVYRCAYDREPLRYNPTATTARWRRPWSSQSERVGGVYDRMCRRVATIPNNTTTEWIDDQTAMTFSGTRPPQPLIKVGSGITLDTRRRVYALPPLNL